MPERKHFNLVDNFEGMVHLSFLTLITSYIYDPSLFPNLQSDPLLNHETESELLKIPELCFFCSEISDPLRFLEKLLQCLSHNINRWFRLTGKSPIPHPILCSIIRHTVCSEITKGRQKNSKWEKYESLI